MAPSPETSPEIAVIVPAHEAETTLGACLDGILAQTLSPHHFEVHVVDTGSDGAEAIFAERARGTERAGMLRLHTAERRGPGAQRNQGVREAGARFLAFTDADCVPDPGWLEAGLARLRAGAAIVQGPTLTPDGSPPPPYAHAIYLRGPSALFESCNIMYEREAFRRGGSFPVDLFETEGSHMGEDTELAWTVKRAGGECAWEPGAVVRHGVSDPDFESHLRYEKQVQFFPRLVARVPELRRERLTAGLFLSPSSMHFSAAVAGAALSPRSKWALALAIPYLADLATSARGAPTPRTAAGAIARRLVSDSVRQAALGWGSAKYRSPVL